MKVAAPLRQLTGVTRAADVKTVIAAEPAPQSRGLAESLGARAAFGLGTGEVVNPVLIW